MFKDLLLVAQEGVSFTNTTLNKLVVYRDEECGLLECGSRIQTFKEDEMAVPRLPCEAWVSLLLAREAHYVNHESIAATIRG